MEFTLSVFSGMNDAGVVKCYPMEALADYLKDNTLECSPTLNFFDLNCNLESLEEELHIYQYAFNGVKINMAYTNLERMTHNLTGAVVLHDNIASADEARVFKITPSQELIEVIHREYWKRFGGAK